MAARPPRNFWIAVGVTALLAAAALCLLPLVGSAHIDYARALAGESPDAEILFYARLPRVLLALLAGGALAVTGALFQALLRDALAEPYTLGVSSGASLGAVIAISAGWGRIAGVPAIWVAALAGAATVLAPTEVPVGVITAMMGGPFFIWLLRSKRRSLWL